MKLLDFAIFSLKELVRGSGVYYLWLAFLVLLILVGAEGYSQQFLHGHIVSNLRDPVPWGLFIGT